MPDTAVTTDKPREYEGEKSPGSRTTSRRKMRLGPTLKLLTLQVLLLIVALAMWQAAVEIGWIDPFFVSEPTAVIERLREVLVDKELYVDVAFTMQNVLVGFALSAVTGVASACIMYKFPLLQKVVDPYILALYSTPRIAIAPLFIIWFGIGPASKIALVFSLCYFIMLLNTYAGLTNVDQRLISQVKMMGASDWFIFRRVSLPASVPWLLSGTRVGLGFALIGAVVGELIISEHGLGLRISRASGLFDTTGVFTYLIIVAALGVILDQAVRLLEKSLSSWGSATAK
ncbi:ABC transporter permease [Rhodococcus jostii]|uniref:NitT/TauT family transport system permease protein n=2 Tax=Rhodococcus jostii TaxID=132919 RepID=A0A1H4IW67_RHOJO|nr:NitT/TauT family transport system permease protein [Rhodococcus jostii]